MPRGLIPRRVGLYTDLRRSRCCIPHERRPDPEPACYCETRPNPATVVSWLGMSWSARLLGHLARTGDPIHDLLDDLPQTQALHYVREVLVNSGVLAARNEHLERLAPSSASYVTRTSSDGLSDDWETP